MVNGTQLLLFRVTAATMIIMASGAGLVTDQNNSDNQEFVNQFTDDGKANEALQQGQQEGIVSQVGVALQSLPIIGFLISIVTAPYTLIGGTPIPPNLTMLFQAVLGILELSLVAGYVRGANL